MKEDNKNDSQTSAVSISSKSSSTVKVTPLEPSAVSSPQKEVKRPPAKSPRKERDPERRNHMRKVKSSLPSSPSSSPSPKKSRSSKPSDGSSHPLSLSKGGRATDSPAKDVDSLRKSRSVATPLKVFPRFLYQLITSHSSDHKEIHPLLPFPCPFRSLNGTVVTLNEAFWFICHYSAITKKEWREQKEGWQQEHSSRSECGQKKSLEEEKTCVCANVSFQICFFAPKDSSRRAR